MKKISKKVIIPLISIGCVVLIFLGLFVAYSCTGLYSKRLSDAVKNQDTARIESILKTPGDVNARNPLFLSPSMSFVETPLSVASCMLYYDAVKMLLENGADPNIGKLNIGAATGALGRRPGKDGYPYRDAVNYERKPEIIKMLVEYGLKPESLTNFARLNFDHEQYELIKSTEAEVFIYVQSINKIAYPERQGLLGNVKICEYLLGNVESVDVSEMLLYSLNNTYLPLEVVEYLVFMGADPNYSGEYFSSGVTSCKALALRSNNPDVRNYFGG